jgi:peptide/nickel transport system substrate-binding protein
MSINISYKLFFIILLACVVTLGACNSSTSKDVKKGSSDKIYKIEDFSTDKTNDDEAIDGGVLNYGLLSDTAFDGTLNWNFVLGIPDQEILGWFDESLLDMDENYNYTNDGAATYEVSDDGRTFTFTIRDEVNWQDGQPVKAEDWAYSFEVIGSPDYDGVRYGSDFSNIEGMNAYHAGEADSISGIKIIDDKTLALTYKEATPSLINGGIWPYAMPKHIFKDIPINEMAASPEVREHPIGIGAFQVESIVPGESVTYKKNKDYWRGEPQLDGVTLKVISPDTAVQSLKNGEVDMLNSFPSDQFPDNADLSNIEYLATVDLSYSYIGFKLGSWDNDKQENVMDPDAKMADKVLRKAMWLAVDNDTVGNKFFHGLQWDASTLIPPSHPEFHDDSNPGLTFDPEAAKQILDDAGYKDVDDDGFRENKNGEELVINFAAMSGGETAEPLTQYYIQAWENIGLHVELLDGRLQEYKSFYDRIEQDDPEIDVYLAGWTVGGDVNPKVLYGRDATLNWGRYTSEKNDQLLEEGLSQDAFDVDYRRKVYEEWQQLMVDDIPIFPTLYKANLIPVNNRVKNYSIDEGTDLTLNELAVTEEAPIKAE